jgi:hypothetical protein
MIPFLLPELHLNLHIIHLISTEVLLTVVTAQVA